MRRRKATKIAILPDPKFNDVVVTKFVNNLITTRFIDFASSIDTYVGEYILQIIESRNHPEQAFKSCIGILSFEKKVGKELLINACKRALDFQTYSFKIIQNILENNIDQAEYEDELDQNLPEHSNIRGKKDFQ